MTARPDVPRPPVVEWEPIRLLLNRPAWHAAAACRDTPTDWWFPGRGESSRRQKQMCRTCPVQPECFAANRDERFGIFGGTSERERRRMRGRGSQNARRGAYKALRAAQRANRAGYHPTNGDDAA